MSLMGFTKELTMRSFKQCIELKPLYCSVVQDCLIMNGNLQSSRVYMEPQSMFPVALSLSRVICCILHTSVLLFPSPPFECKEMPAIEGWL